jgi:hypothetical protein
MVIPHLSATIFVDSFLRNLDSTERIFLLIPETNNRRTLVIIPPFRLLASLVSFLRYLAEVLAAIMTLHPEYSIVSPANLATYGCQIGPHGMTSADSYINFSSNITAFQITYVCDEVIF